jgi:hypothetical protein
MKFDEKRNSFEGPCSRQDVVYFDLESIDEIEKYKQACSLLSDAAQKAKRELGLGKADESQFTEICSFVSNGQLKVVVHRGMIG